MKHPARQNGMTLIEVLVAVLILSIGLLGLAGLQTTSLANNHNAYLRSQANILAYDIIDRMRANRAAALNGSYNIALDDDAPTGTGIVQQDLNQWISALDGDLPSGDGSVSVSSGAVTVIVQWDESRGQSETTQFEVRTRI